jgi:putative spermidine/putrescine transport system substrate-binding protein
MMKNLIFVFVIFALALAACAPAVQAPAASGEFDLDDWDSVLAAARGQTVNWYIWGGADSINAYVDNFYGKALKERYDITLNRIPLAATEDAVNQVLSEKQAGTDPGAVDLIWINGENFFTLKQADMLYTDWAQKLPNAALVNWDNPAINLDFGTPVDNMESPWSSAQFQLVYDSARMSADDLPRSYAELKDWACANPGRFTYVAPGPGGFIGTRFLKGALYELSGGEAQWKTFDQATWDNHSPTLWDYLNELEPCLWRSGEAYPANEPEMVTLFANGEIDFSFTQDISGAGRWIADGLMPPTARTFVFDQYMIGDFNYVAIPANAPNKAAALVLANLLLEPELQAAQILPENGFGLGYAIDVTRVADPEAKAQLEAAAAKLGEAATPAADLARSLAGDTAPQYQGLVEQGWLEFVVQK